MTVLQHLQDIIFGPKISSFCSLINQHDLNHHQHMQQLQKLQDERNADFFAHQRYLRQLKALISEAYARTAANMNKEKTIDFGKFNKAFGHELDLLRLQYNHKDVLDVCRDLDYKPCDSRG